MFAVIGEGRTLLLETVICARHLAEPKLRFAAQDAGGKGARLSRVPESFVEKHGIKCYICNPRVLC